MDRTKFLIFLSLAILLYGCTTFEKKCPANCDDNNPCTRDYCGSLENYECQHYNFGEGQIGCAGSDGACNIKPCSETSCKNGENRCHLNKKFNFSFVYPSDASWRIDIIDSEDNATEVHLNKYSKENETSIYCMFLATTLPQDYDYFEFNTSINTSTAYYTSINATFLVNTDRIIRGMNWHEWIMKFPRYGNSMLIRRDSMTNKTYYTLSCNIEQYYCDNCSKNAFEDSINVSQNIINTFKIVD